MGRWNLRATAHTEDTPIVLMYRVLTNDKLLLAPISLAVIVSSRLSS
jgi:hypothetical protein